MSLLMSFTVLNWGGGTGIMESWEVISWAKLNKFPLDQIPKPSKPEETPKCVSIKWVNQAKITLFDHLVELWQRWNMVTKTEDHFTKTETICGGFGKQSPAYWSDCSRSSSEQQAGLNFLNWIFFFRGTQKRHICHSNTYWNSIF